MKKKHTIFFILLLVPQILVGGLFTNYAQQKPEETIAALEKKQIDAPHDPYVNYNLGVALYKAGNYAQAVKNFERVAANKKIDEDFSLRARFNAGNSSYRAVLESLGTGWEEKKELDDKILEQAIAHTKAAIASYEEVIKLDDEHEPAKNNKKLADGLLQKLEEKKKKQEQEKQDKKDDKKDQKKDNEKKDDKQNKDQQDKQDKKDKQDQKDKNDKQDKNDKKDQKKDEQGEQDRDKSDQQDDKDKQDKGEQDQNKQDGDQDKKDEQGANKSDEQKEQERKEQEQQEREQEEKEAQAKTDEQKEQEAAQAAAAQAAQGNEQEKDDEGMQKRGIRAVLENLDEDESKKQKGFIVQQVKGGQASEQRGQKPW